jgi:hypothetical protein
MVTSTYLDRDVEAYNNTQSDPNRRVVPMRTLMTRSNNSCDRAEQQYAAPPTVYVDRSSSGARGRDRFTCSILGTVSADRKSRKQSRNRKGSVKRVYPSNVDRACQKEIKTKEHLIIIVRPPWCAWHCIAHVAGV